jgi:hypothetical protein
LASASIMPPISPRVARIGTVSSTIRPARPTERCNAARAPSLAEAVSEPLRRQVSNRRESTVAEIQRPAWRLLA